MFTSKPEIQIEIETISALLSALPVGEVATYSQIDEAIGHSIQKHRIPLIKAQRRVEKATGFRFATVPRVGIKKLSSDSLVGIGKTARKRISRVARRQAERLTDLRYNDIDAQKQARIDAERSLLGAISAVAGTDISKVERLTQTGPAVAARVLDAVKAENARI